MKNLVKKDQQEQLVKKNEKVKKEISLDDLNQVSGGSGHNSSEDEGWDWNPGG